MGFRGYVPGHLRLLALDSGWEVSPKHLTTTLILFFGISLKIEIRASNVVDSLKILEGDHFRC